MQGSISYGYVIIHNTFHVLGQKCGMKVLAVDVKLDCQRVNDLFSLSLS